MILWHFSAHAESRIASRMNLILDKKTKEEISRLLEGSPTRVTSNYGRDIFEINVLGTSIVAVCDTPRRVVITLMEAKRWYRRVKNGRGRNMLRRRRHRLKDRFDDDDL